MQGHFLLERLAAEPSLFSCSMEHAEQLGGELTKEILHLVKLRLRTRMKAAYAAGLTEIIDVRVQRLMPRMFPSIPGWHCDAVPRANYFSQPEFERVNPHSFHTTMILDSNLDGHEVSNTSYLQESIDFVYDEKLPVWKQLHDQIEDTFHRVFCWKPGELITFDSFTPHKAKPCLNRGWRLFFRMSMYHNPPVANKVQNAQQVYILSEANGW
jgi:hypothetical protein